jgi:hypothetical protein
MATQTDFNVIDNRAAWHATDMAASDEWIYRLADDDIAELEAALRHVRRRNLQIPDIGRDDFPLPSFGNSLRMILEEIEDGRGFALLRGLPLDRFSDDEASIIYWGIGMHFGRPAAQNAQGDLLGHVRDQGRDWDKDYSARGYQTTSGLPYHNDSADMVGLLCYRKAKQGGLSCIVSSVTAHNAMLARRPDLARIFYEPFHVDCRGEERPDEQPYYTVPRFNFHQGRLFVQYSRMYIESAQRFEDVPRLTAAQTEAMNLFEEIANSDAYRLDMDFERGDIQFVNNHVILHARTDYEDFDEPELKRHLLRLWLFSPGHRARPPAFQRRYADMEYWHAHPRT